MQKVMLIGTTWSEQSVCGHSGFDQVIGTTTVGNSQHSGC